MLHITNGDSTVALLQATGLPGVILSWRDVLHEGPVPAELSLEELSARRARFIADQGWGELEEVRHGFERRDATLASFREHGDVVLWFEHDLYDQLQLIQILDFLAGQERGTATLELVCIDRHPSVEPFYGLGQLRPQDLAALFDDRRPVEPGQLELAVSAWRAFRDADPRSITAWLEQESSALPFLAPALRRHLEQFPAVDDGLGRTERQVLEGVAAGRATPSELFRYDQEREESPFLGDLTYFTYVKRMMQGRRPLLRAATGSAAGEFPGTRLTLTDDGRRVLESAADQIDLNGIDRWLGGVRLRDRRVWRWDGPARRVLQ